MKADVVDAVIPRLGSSDDTDEVKVLTWLLNPGGSVQEQDGLLALETGKVTVEIEAPGTGVLLQQKTQEDQYAKFNAIVAIDEVDD